MGALQAARWGMLLLSAAVLACFAWRDAAVAYWMTEGASAAPASIRTDARIAVAAADEARQSALIDGAAARPNAAPMPDAARQALAAAPLDPAALRQLGEAGAARDPQRSVRLLSLSGAVSRRDAMTQYQLFQVAAEENDDERALAHLDRLLLVSPGAGQQLFGPMASLIDHEGTRGLFAPYRGRPWFERFAGVAVDRADDPAAAAVLLAMVDPQSERHGQFLPRLLTRLVAEGRYGEAKRFAETIGHADPAALDRFAIGSVTVDPRFVPLGWRLAPGRDARIEAGGDGALDIAVHAGRPVVLLERVTALAPGHYRLDQKVGGGESGAVDLEWQMQCRQGSGYAAAWRQAVPVSGKSVHFRSGLSIPGACAIQRWQLRASLFDGGSGGARFRIADLSLTRGGD